MDSTIHKCEVKQREMRKKYSAPKLNGLTDDKIFELIDYYGGRGGGASQSGSPRE